MAKKKQYPYIQAWGTYMGSHQYYIDNQMDDAADDNAPDDAYRKNSTTGKWETYSTAAPHVKKILDDNK